MMPVFVLDMLNVKSNWKNKIFATDCRLCSHSKWARVKFGSSKKKFRKSPVLLLKRLQCKMVANRCSKSRRSSRIIEGCNWRDSGNYIKSLHALSWGSRHWKQNERRDRRKDFIRAFVWLVHLNSCNSILISQGDSFWKKGYRTMFLKTFPLCLACSVDVFFGWTNVLSSRSFIRPAMLGQGRGG